MNTHHHIIKNFPKNYPFWKKVYANILFFIGGIIIHHRKNLLTKEDLRQAFKTLKKGDLVLVGGLRKASAIFIDAPLTHSMIYTGHRTFIHSIGDGVEYASLHEVFCEYDTMLILRLKNHTRKIVKKMIRYAKNQVGKPYSFDFKMRKSMFYCSALIHYALKAAGLNPKNFETSNYKGKLKPHALHPMNFIGKGFEIVCKSHNLMMKNKKIVLVEEPAKQKAPLIPQMPGKLEPAYESSEICDPKT